MPVSCCGRGSDLQSPRLLVRQFDRQCSGTSRRERGTPAWHVPWVTYDKSISLPENHYVTKPLHSKSTRLSGRVRCRGGDRARTSLAAWRGGARGSARSLL